MEDRDTDRRLPLAGALLGLAMAAGCNCGDPATANGTALFVATTWGSDVTADQLRYTVRRDGGTVVGPETLPAGAGSPLLSGQTVRVLLPDDLADTLLTVRVDSLASGAPTGHGAAEVSPPRGREVNVSVALQKGGGDLTCTAANCPNGCCIFGQCRLPATSPYCGTGGKVCGLCGATADNCANGTCRCGQGNPCKDGQRCSSGNCICDTRSGCQGCCENGDQCIPFADQGSSKCGAAGYACTSCQSGTCTNGVCTGIGSGCGVCAGGCCAGNTCVSSLPGAYPTCSTGVAATACKACDPDRSNVCNSHGCGCSTGSQCDVPQVCQGALGCVTPAP